MPNTHRPALIALAAFLAVALAQPAGAQSLSAAREQREAARRKRAEIAAKVNQLKASDAQLEGAVSTLNEQVAAQQASADAARQSVQAALDAVAESEARIAATERQMGSLRAAVVSRAVSAYVRPQDDTIANVFEAKDLGEASRRKALLEQVNNNDSELIDGLRSARQDLDAEQDKAARARDLAGRRRKEVLGELTKLQIAQREKTRLSEALDARIRDYQMEADAVAKQEDGLNALIRSKEQVRIPAPQIRVDRGSAGPVSKAGMSWPVRGPVTSPYGYRWGRLHAGIDIGAGSGTPIRAAKAGQVVFSGVMNGYGNVIVINHGGGLSTLYAHQSRLGARDGQSVAQGEVIGAVGSTGRSTGPHLHFETRVGGSPQNPRPYLS
ncbi:MAG: peptidoglycan DD-metalloendopeptidase family protein [Actinomycetota bacterium]|nr:peptidoglycan DD-metalloendopeptidase family protein [Actinomycetota bacterium]